MRILHIFGNNIAKRDYMSGLILSTSAKMMLERGELLLAGGSVVIRFQTVSELYDLDRLRGNRFDLMHIDRSFYRLDKAHVHEYLKAMVPYLIK